MEYHTNEELGFLEELLGLREMEYNNINYADQHFNNNNGGWSLDYNFADDNNFPAPASTLTNTTADTCFQDYSLPPPPLIDDHNHHHQILMNNCYTPFGEDHKSPPPDQFAVVDSSSLDTQTVLPYCHVEDYYSMPSILGGDDEDGALFGNGVLIDEEAGAPFCKAEPVPEMPGFNMGFCAQTQSETRKNKAKKLGGQPSKNLMAERRRRKRLNDRLSMLRSVVPKISKMDRTSILGDTIDYMKELLERINNLQQQMHLGSNQLSLMTIFKDVKPNEVLVRNSPKFEVERRKNGERRIEICCGGKAGLLVSTVNTIEALGLEIKQCVISCFHDFSLQASCSEELKKRGIVDSEDIKQALLRNAGYGGRCL
ncbi:hypothetical protein ACP275_14G280200 [Erythranthe tilingii]